MSGSEDHQIKKTVPTSRVSERKRVEYINNDKPQIL